MRTKERVMMIVAVGLVLWLGQEIGLWSALLMALARELFSELVTAAGVAVILGAGAIGIWGIMGYPYEEEEVL